LENKEGGDGVFGRIRLFNAAMAILHALQGLLMLALSSDYSLPVTTTFLRGGGPLDQPRSPEVLVRLRIGPLVAAFLFLSALAHFLLILPGIFEWYRKNLSRGMNPARWMEYSLSASLMIVLIAMLSGIYELGALVLIFFLNACMILFGWLMELMNQYTERLEWLPFYFGCLAGIVPWVVVAVYFFGALADPQAQVPTFVYFILPILFVLFNVFAVNMVLQYRKVGPWRDYLFGERIYILLSLVAKSFLAWMVFGGTLRGS